MLRRLAAGMLSLALLQSGAIAADDWQRYTNGRFGTSAEFPAHMLIAEAPPANGSGQSYASSDGLVRISIFGSFLVLVDDFEAYRQDRLNLAKEGGVEVTYTAGENDWFVYSGLKDGDIVYFKAIPACGGEAASHVVLTYPQTQKETMDPVVVRVSKSLRSLPGSDCP